MGRGPWFVGALLVALVLVGPLTRLVTDAWWFDSVGHGDVFRTILAVQAGLGLTAGLVAFAIVGGSTRLATRKAPHLPRVGPAPRPGWIGRVARTPPLVAADALAALIALLAAGVGAGGWQEVLLFVYGGPFGWVDPVWGLDARFYVFDLGLFEAALRGIALLLGVALVVSAATYVAQGTIRIQLAQQDGQLVATGVVIPADAQRHLASLVAAGLAAMALLTWLARYAAMYDQDGLVAGPGYAELHATLPLLTVEAIGTALGAFAAVVAIGRGSVAGFGAVLAAIAALKLVGAVVPVVVQRFGVLPNELSREAPQIHDHIAATRFAFGLDGIEEIELPGKDALTRADIERNQATIRNVRLWDHEPLLDAFSQVQEIRTYYGFVGVDNDRYWLDGEERQVMSSPRELTIASLPSAARTWVNTTMIYTHGYGLALGPVNEVGDQGLPELFVSDLPPKVRHAALRIDRPEIYFGEATRHAVIVGTRNAEFDFPSGDDNAYARYAGKDGVRLGTFGRLLFALRLGSAEVLLSGDLSRDSKVLYYRNVVERAKRIAPFLTFDSDPYLVIHEGRLVWLLDGYTSTSRFPYAASVSGLGNYLRNPVKVTIDAYDGAVAFYRLDDADPIAAAWAAAFPGLFRPIDELAPGLRAHLRYPADLFAAQANLFATYHMEDHQVFYNREDEWEVPTFDNRRMDPYHTVMRLPRADRDAPADGGEEFILMLPFTPRGKPNLSAWMVARSDGDAYGQLRVYKFPKDTMVFGPKMVVARVNQDDAISEKLSLWNQQGSEVQLGTLLVIPIERSLVYVQPLYLRAAQGSIPELKRVIVAYEDEIVMAASLDEGLDRLFGGGASTATDPTTGALLLPEVTTVGLIRQAGLHWDAAQQALTDRDLVLYGQHVTALGELLAALRAGVDGQPPPAPAPLRLRASAPLR